MDAYRRAFRDNRFGWYQNAAPIYRLMGQADGQRRYGDSLRTWAESSPERELALPENAIGIAYAHFTAGLGYAFLGEAEAARHHRKRALELVPTSVDALNGPVVAFHASRISLLLGDAESCIDLLETVLAVPSRYSVALLRLDPRFDPLRSHPRFQALLEKYEQPPQ